MYKYIMVVVLLGVSFFSAALCASSDISTPAFVFTVQPQAKILNNSYNQKVDDYVLALANYKKSDDRWLPEKYIRLQGQLTRFTVELPRDYDIEQVFTSYRQQIPKDAKLLFYCEKRQCGESNNWANDHFGVKQLYGLNSSQYLAVYEYKQPKHSMYISVYGVLRGNRRLYLQLEQLNVAE